MIEGFAGTIQPWWHHIGSYHEDRRQYRTAEPIMKWHSQNDQYLLIRWSDNGNIPVEIEGPGLVDCHIYRQDQASIMHLVNLTGTTQQPLHEFIPVGPFHIRIKGKGSVRSLVAL